MSGRLPILVFSGTVTSAEEVRELAALGVAGYINEYSAVEHILPSLAPHLFPENFNRRDSPRVVLGIPVAYRVGRHDCRGADAQPQSRRHRDPHRPARSSAAPALKLRFALPGSKKEIEREAVVCWSDAEGRAWACSSRASKPADQSGDRRLRRRALLQVGEDGAEAEPEA